MSLDSEDEPSDEKDALDIMRADVEENRDAYQQMADAENIESDENPCGEIHPLPCGVDKECGFIENYTSNEELRELIEQWRDTQEKREQNPDANPVRAQVLGRCAGELEELLE